jgi:hypothetical protein
MTQITVTDCMGAVVAPDFCPLAEAAGVALVCRHPTRRNEPEGCICTYDRAAGIEMPKDCPLRRLPEALIVEARDL